MNNWRRRVIRFPLAAVILVQALLTSYALAAPGLPTKNTIVDKSSSPEPGQFNYEAVLKDPLPRGRKIVVGGIAWDCTSGKACSTAGPWPIPGVRACASLSRQVGEIVRYGHPGRSLSKAQLAQCSQARGLRATQPRPSIAPVGPTSQDLARSPAVTGGGLQPDSRQITLPRALPQDSFKQRLRTLPIDLGIERVTQMPQPGGGPILKGDRVPMQITVRNHGGPAAPAVITTTGDTRVRQILNKSAPLTIAPGAAVVVPLEMYVNPQHVRGGVFRAYVWLGTSREPLVYRDNNRDNNLMEVAFQVQERPRQQAWQPPRTAGRSGGGSSGSCDDSRIGTACQVQPEQCTGRGADWTVAGTYQCVRGEPECVARAGIDYCDVCGPNCGGCTTSSCSVENLCAPGSLCIDNPAIYPRPTCRNLNDDYVARTYGRRVCTHIPGFCWTPGEVGMAEIICVESRS